MSTTVLKRPSAESFLSVYDGQALDMPYQHRQAIYAEFFAIDDLTVDARGKCGVHHLKRGMHPALMVALNILTLGIVPLWLQLSNHSRLPAIRHSDCSGRKAIGFSLIPGFNWFYWQIHAYLLLADRINLQFRIRNEPPRISRTLVLWATITNAVGIFVFPVWAFSWLILWSVLVAQIQSAVNELARMPD